MTTNQGVGGSNPSGYTNQKEMFCIMKIQNIEINIKLGDITEENVDAIVNAANNSLLGGGGVDGAIHKKAGPSLLEQCKKHGGCATGEACITTAGNLKCKYIIHTVGPIYGRHKGLESLLLYNCYFNSLKLADEYTLNSISFPAISTGAYGYPVEETLQIIYKAILNFAIINQNIKNINFVLFSKEKYDIYNNYFMRI